MRIHMWSADEAGSGMYRCKLPGTALSWVGHYVTVGTRLPADWKDYDVIVGARVALKGASDAWTAMQGHVRLVLDLDDNYFQIDPLCREVHDEWATGGLQGQLAANIQLADAVTVCSQELKRVVENLNPNVSVIPNGLPAQYLGLPRDYTQDAVNIGWAGTSSTVLELPLVARALNRIAAYKPDVHVTCVGIDPAQGRAAGLKHKDVYTTGWIPDWEMYAGTTYQFDVWVAPYRDTPFNRAKFATKALEAGMFGIPLIATALPGYQDWITHGSNGFLVPVGQEHLFGRYLKQLVDNPVLRRAMGENARARASQNILQGLGTRWEKALS